MVRRHLSRLLRNAGRIRAEADEEIDFHLERRIAELEQRGLSQAEAAVVQSCPPGTVAWRIHEALKRLRRAVDKPPPPPRRARRDTDESTARLGEWLRASPYLH